MANIFDYLTWRGDVPFSVDPFNEVDNLVLSELAYTDFAGCVPPDGNAVALPAAYEAFFRRHTREEISADPSFVARAPLLMEEMAAGTRFRNTTLRYYINEIDPERNEQISAVTFTLADGTVFAAFRGTDDTVVGWKEDFGISYLVGTAGQRRAARYLDEIARTLPGPLRVGGHSKGGNFAVYAASFCEPAVQDRIEAVYSNDGPGFREEITQAEGYRRLLPRVRSIVPESSVIGMLLSSASTPRVVRSAASGIWQHDALSWEVRRNRFIEAELSESARFVRQTMTDWLRGMDDAARKAFTDTLFSILEATGHDTISGIGEEKWKSAEAMLATMSGLPKERQRDMRRFLGQLLQSGGRAAAEQLANLPALKKWEEEIREELNL